MSDLIERLTNPPRMSVAANRDHLERLLYALIAEAAAELARLTAEVERLRANDGRYRFLRGWWFDETAPMTVNEAETSDELDAAIDEAIKEAGNG